MSEIKVGDEVLVKGKVYSVHEGQISLEMVTCLGQPLTTVLRDECIKIEPTFVITPQDVGRFAKSTRGAKCHIFYYDANNEMYRFTIVSSEHVDVCDRHGNAGFIYAHNLVAWWDE